MECEQQEEPIIQKGRAIAETDQVFTLEGPNGMIEIVAVQREDSTALSDLYDTIAEILIKQALREARIQKEAAHMEAPR